MKPVIIFILFLFSLNSCFIGADTYEKSVNDYFFLYSDTYKTDKVCLGTIDYNYRIGDGYGCFIKKIGWDNFFLIYQTKQDKYFIQDLRQLKGKHPEEFKRYLYGPFNIKQFELERGNLQVDKDLDFSISY